MTKCFRYLVLIEDYKQVYAFDRDNNVFQLHGLSFVNRKTGQPLRGTLVDAEMIIDKAMDERTKEVVETPRLLIYDIISFEVDDFLSGVWRLKNKKLKLLRRLFLFMNFFSTLEVLLIILGR